MDHADVNIRINPAKVSRSNKKRANTMRNYYFDGNNDSKYIF